MTPGSFYNLTPHVVLEAAEKMGFFPTGRCTQLNSYENRVFEIDTEDQQKIILKFYRPGRWSKEALLDEHQFLSELRDQDILVSPPLHLKDGATLLKYEELWVTGFKKIQGRMLQEVRLEDLKKIGRRVAQIHNVGADKKALNRLSMADASLLEKNLEILESRIYPELRSRYLRASSIIVDVALDSIDPKDFIRIHGDVHRGNILDNGSDFYFVDFDDFCNGLPVQDLWMVVDGDPEEISLNVDAFLDGYTELRDFSEDSLKLVPLLRGLRIFNYSAWIAQRWADPSFPKIFPEYESYLYWLEETECLENIAQNF